MIPSLRILVVEDEDTVADAMRRHLEHGGHAVRVAANAATAIADHARERVDLAFIDLVLGGPSGMSVLQALRQAPEPPECVMVTGNGTIAVAVEAMQHGACDFVTKPFTLEDLDARVRLATMRRLARRNTGSPEPLDAIERRHIAEVLARTHWHQGRAAALLGISAKTLYRKIREYGFTRPDRRVR